MAALLPSLLLYFPNMDEISFAGMLPYFGIMLGIGILAWAGMYLVFRRKGLASVTAAVWLLVLLNAGRAAAELRDRYPALGNKVIGLAVFVLLIVITFGLSRLKEEFLKDAARVLCLALAAFILTSAVPQFFRGPEPAETEEEPAAEAETIDLAPAEGTDRPNIYWIVSDEYAGPDELSKYYHYDNSAFYDSLRALGFTVSDHSYNWSSDTFRILRDILNLKYTPSPGRTRAREQAIARKDLPLWTLLGGLGYDLHRVESTNKFSLDNRLKAGIRDDSARTSDGKAVANLLLEYSVLYPFEDEILRVAAPALAAATDREAVLNVFEWAENPENIREPGCNFTVIYVKCPHEPFLFDRDGGEVPREHRHWSPDKKYYLDQLVYVTGRLRKICENITREDPDSIIILQSDHGHRFVENVTMLDLTNVLNAVYFRGETIGEIVDKNALNTWRAVLRKQFRLDLPELEEKRLRNEYREASRNPKAEDPNEGLIPESQ